MNITLSTTNVTPPTTPNPWAHVKLRTAKKGKKKRKIADNDEIRLQIEKLKKMQNAESEEMGDNNFLSSVRLRSVSNSPRDRSIPGSPMSLYVNQKMSLRNSARFSELDDDPSQKGFAKNDSENENKNEKEITNEFQFQFNVENSECIENEITDNIEITENIESIENIENESNKNTKLNIENIENEDEHKIEEDIQETTVIPICTETDEHLQTIDSNLKTNESSNAESALSRTINDDMKDTETIDIPKETIDIPKETIDIPPETKDIETIDIPVTVETIVKDIETKDIPVTDIETDIPTETKDDKLKTEERTERKPTNTVKPSIVRFADKLQGSSEYSSDSDSDSSMPLKHYKNRSSFDFSQRISNTSARSIIIYKDIECDSDDYLPSSTERDYDNEYEEEEFEDEEEFDDAYEDYHDDSYQSSSEEPGKIISPLEAQNNLSTKLPVIQPKTNDQLNIVVHDEKIEELDITGVQDSDTAVPEFDITGVEAHNLETGEMKEYEGDTRTPSISEICLENVKKVLTQRKASMYSDGGVTADDDMEWLFDEEENEEDAKELFVQKSQRSASMHALFALLMRTEEFNDAMPFDMQIEPVDDILCESSVIDDLLFETSEREYFKSITPKIKSNKSVSFSEPDSKYVRIHYPNRSSTNLLPKYALPRISTVLDDEVSAALGANLLAIGEEKVVTPNVKRSNPIIGARRVASPTLRKINQLSMFSGHELQTLTFQALVNTIPLRTLLRSVKFFSVSESRQILKLVKRIGKLVLKGELFGTYAEEYGLHMGDSIITTHTATPDDNKCSPEVVRTPKPNDKFVNEPQGNGIEDCVFFDDLKTNCVQLRGHCKICVGGIFGDGNGVGFGVLRMPVDRSTSKYKKPLLCLGVQCNKHGIMIDIDDRFQITDRINEKYHNPIGGMNGWNVKTRVNFMIENEKEKGMNILKIIAFKYLSFCKPIQRRIQICSCNINQIQAFIEQNVDIGKYYCSKLIKPPAM